MPVPYISFGSRLRALPGAYRQFLVAVGLVRRRRVCAHHVDLAGHAKTDADRLGATRATSIAVALYLLHNIFYAALRFYRRMDCGSREKEIVLAIGYSMAAMMAIAIMTLPVSIWTFALIFILGGTNVALEETSEDSLCAEMVNEKHHGMAFGLLATVNGVGDFLSSVIVGLLWTAFGTTIAFGYSAILSIVGAAHRSARNKRRSVTSDEWPVSRNCAWRNLRPISPRTCGPAGARFVIMLSRLREIFLLNGSTRSRPMNARRLTSRAELGFWPRHMWQLIACHRHVVNRSGLRV